MNKLLTLTVLSATVMSMACNIQAQVSAKPEDITTSRGVTVTLKLPVRAVLSSPTWKGVTFDPTVISGFENKGVQHSSPVKARLGKKTQTGMLAGETNYLVWQFKISEDAPLSDASNKYASTIVVTGIKPGDNSLVQNVYNIYVKKISEPLARHAMAPLKKAAVKRTIIGGKGTLNEERFTVAKGVKFQNFSQKQLKAALLKRSSINPMVGTLTIDEKVFPIHFAAKKSQLKSGDIFLGTAVSKSSYDIVYYSSKS